MPKNLLADYRPQKNPKQLFKRNSNVSSYGKYHIQPENTEQSLCGQEKNRRRELGNQPRTKPIEKLEKLAEKNEICQKCHYLHQNKNTR